VAPTVMRSLPVKAGISSLSMGQAPPPESGKPVRTLPNS
jgi:hypothetical protein